MSGRESRLFEQMRHRFADMPLSRQFLVAGGLLMLAAMAIAGFLVSGIVGGDTIRARAVSTAVFVSSIATPLTQELIKSPELSERAIAALDAQFGSETFRERFPLLEIWSPQNVIVYSTSVQLIGRSFAAPTGLTHALTGEVASEFADLGADEHTLRGIDTPYLEVYVPLRAAGSDRIIAVAEIHEAAQPLQARLRDRTIHTWAIVAGSTAIIIAGLFGIVSRASATIERQRIDLSRRMAEAETMSAQNLQLKLHAERASARFSELSERFIRNIGADLHDGPAQAIGYSILKLEQVKRATSQKGRVDALASIEAMLQEAAAEVRTISKGLLLPDIEHLSLDEVIKRAIDVHQRRTRTETDLVIDIADFHPAVAVRICVFRFVQEGLANAFRHAKGNDQAVRCVLQGGRLVVSVSDSGGEAFALGEDHASDSRGPGFGLQGMLLRVESIGGEMAVRDLAERGRIVEMSLNISGGHSID